MIKHITNSAMMFIGLLFLVSCSDNNSEENKNTGIYKPELNSHPKYYMTVSGTINKDLAQHKLIWKVIYTTYNDACKVVVNKLEGVSVSREEDIFTVVEPDSKGAYKYQLPLDKFLPGFCDWRVNTVQFNLANSGYGTLVTFAKNGHFERSHAGETIKCDITDLHAPCQLINYSVYAKDDDTLPYNKSFSYELNIR